MIFRALPLLLLFSVACTNGEVAMDAPAPCPDGFVGDPASGCVLPNGATSSTFDAEGGTLTTDDGAELVVPPDTVDTPIEIVVTEGVNAPATPPQYLAQLGDAFEFGPSGATFDPPLELTLTYPQGDMLEGSLEERLIGFHYIEVDGSVEEAAVLARNLETNSLTVALPHFSFGILTRFAIDSVADGTVTDPVAVELINDEVVDVLESLEDDERQELIAAESAYAQAAAPVLGRDPFEGIMTVARFSVRVTVNGLAGTGLVLRNNGGDDLAVSANGTSAFGETLEDGSGYSVEVHTTPTAPSQACSVSGGTGTLAGADVTVTVSCTTNTFTVSGTIDGLAGNGLVLQNNAGDPLAVSGPGSFAFEFSDALEDLGAYAVTVATQPSAPSQTCTVANGSGTLAGAPVTNVAVTCTTDTFAVGGTVSGLAGSRLTLNLNDTESLSVSADGPFAFGALADGSPYAVTVDAQPAGQFCMVTDGSGTLDGAANNIAVSCLNFAVSGSPGARGVLLSWNDVGATTYDLLYSTDEGCDLSDVLSCTGGGQAMDVESPYPLAGLSPGEVYFIIVRANGDRSATLAETVQRPSPIVVDESVWSSEVAADGTVYLGGDFTFAAPSTGGGVRLTTGPTAEPRPFPEVAGDVFTAASDGAGGFYIGGVFLSVGGASRAYLAHVLADGSVSDWDPGVNNVVDTIVVDAGTVYLGGRFSTVGGESRSRLAAVDASTGELIDWNPGANGTVWTLAIDDGTVYVGGSFTNVAGQSRTRLAALDATTGALRDWDPGANNIPYDIAIDAGTIYIAGNFTSVDGQSRAHLAAFDASTGALNNWDPSANAVVWTLAVDAGLIYAGGLFTEVAGQSRSRLAAIDAVTGMPTDWAPEVDGVNVVRTLVVDAGIVYIGGSFTRIEGQTRARLAALNASTGALTDWDPGANGAAQTLATDGSTIYAGGQFTGVGGQGRERLLALEGSTGALTDWNPGADERVWGIAATDTSIYVGGDFANVGEQARARIAAIDVSTGLVTDFDPGADNTVRAFVVDSGTVYVGGAFTTFAGETRNHLAAFDAETGVLSDWNPDANSVVRALAIDAGTIYVGGDFGAVGSEERFTLAAVDATSGAVTDWNPASMGSVFALAVDDGTVFIGGAFTAMGTMGDVARSRLAAVDATTGTILNWDPGAGATVRALAVHDGTIYAGGDFGSVAGETRRRLAAVDATTGTIAPWDPSAENDVRTLAVSGATIYAGGEFDDVGGQLRGFVAGIDAVTGVVE
ncbi:MAG: hypothetical protein AAF654_15125 [Myxococcota bacterium]